MGVIYSHLPLRQLEKPTHESGGGHKQVNL